MVPPLCLLIPLPEEAPWPTLEDPGHGSEAGSDQGKDPRDWYHRLQGGPS